MELFVNNAQAVLAAPITATATSLTLSSGQGAQFPNPTGGDFFRATLISVATPTNIEIVKVTARSGDTFTTIVRTVEGTNYAFVAGDGVEARPTAGMLGSFITDLANNPMINRGTVTLANQGTAILGGYYQENDGSSTSSLLAFNAGGNTGPVQLWFTSLGAMLHRNKANSTTWSPWQTSITDVNYNTYAPTLTGLGATGTWPISISGTAYQASNLLVTTSSNNNNYYVTFVDGISGTQAPLVSTAFAYNPYSNLLSVTATNAIISKTMAGGGNNQLMYQISTGQTGFIPSPPVNNCYLYWNGYNFIWSPATTAGVASFSGGPTGLTPSTATTGPITLGGQLNPVYGGTGLTAYSTGDLIYASATNVLSRLPVGVSGYILSSTGTVPSYINPSTLSVNYAASAGTTGSTANLAGGLSGSIPYQTAAGATAMLAKGTGVLVGGTTPYWSNTPAILGTNITAIPNSALAYSSMTLNGNVVPLGGSATIQSPSPFSLVLGTGLTGGSYSGSAAITAAIDTTIVATLTGTQTLTGKTISGASNTLSSIGNTSLTNSSITINGTSISLGGSVTISAASAYPLTNGTGITGSAYTGSAAVTFAIDTTVVGTLNGTQTFTNKTISGSANTLTNIGNASLTNSAITIGSTSVSLGSTVLNLAGLASVTSTTFTGSLTGTATSISGGAANQLPYQTGVSTTGFIPAPTVASTFLQWTGTAFAWAVGNSVTSVGLSLPTIFTVSNSPVTSSGTLTATLASQTAATVFAAPSGAAGTPTFRSLLASDIPTLNQNTTGSAATLTTARTLAGNSFNGSANVPFNNAFIVQGTTDAGLTGAQFLGALATGIVKNSTSTGVLSIAVAGTDYVTPSGSITGAAGSVSHSLTLISGGGGAVSGSTFNGSAAITLSYNSIGAAPTQSPVFTGTVTLPAGTTTVPPVLFSSGPLLTTAIANSLEYDGTYVYQTTSAGARKALAYADGTGASGTWPINISGSVSKISGGLVNQIVYQTGASTTGFIPAPTTASTYLLWNGTSFTWGSGSSGGGGTVTNVSVVSANGFSGSVLNSGSTPTITLSTSVSGIIKGNGTSISAASAGTDYAPPTSGTSLLYGNGSGGFSNVTIGSGINFTGGVLTSTGSMTYPVSSGIAVFNGTSWGTSLTAPASSVVGISDTQTLSNKTISGASNTISNIGNASLTNSSIVLNGTSISLGQSASVSASTSYQLTLGSGLTGVSFNGSSAVTAAVDPLTVALVSNTLTLSNKTISGASNTLTNIGNASLTNSSITINGTSVSLGGSTTITAVNPYALTNGTGLTGSTYTGSAAVTFAIDTTVVATLTGTQTLTGKTISGASNTLSSIGNTSLTNSSITINGTSISLGGSNTITAVNPFTLTNGTGLTGSAYTGSAAVTFAIDTTVVGTLTGVQTFTNKRINPRVVSTGTSTSLSINGDLYDKAMVTALATALTVTTPTGTPVDGQNITIRITDNGTAQSLAWTTSAGGWRPIGTLTLPSTTVAGTTMYIGAEYNAAASFWDVVAVTW